MIRLRLYTPKETYTKFFLARCEDFLDNGVSTDPQIACERAARSVIRIRNMTPTCATPGCDGIVEYRLIGLDWCKMCADAMQ